MDYAKAIDAAIQTTAYDTSKIEGRKSEVRALVTEILAELRPDLAGEEHVKLASFLATQVFDTLIDKSGLKATAAICSYDDIVPTFVNGAMQRFGLMAQMSKSAKFQKDMEAEELAGITRSGKANPEPIDLRTGEYLG